MNLAHAKVARSSNAVAADRPVMLDRREAIWPCAHSLADYASYPDEAAAGNTRIHAL